MNDLILGPQAPLDDTWFTRVQITKGKLLGEACPVIPPDNTEAEVIKVGTTIVTTYNMLHYYDLARNQYANHKRTGDTYFLTQARKCADSYWLHPLWIGGGTIRPWPDSAVTPKFAGVGGLTLRALDGKPEYWDWINSYTRFVFDHWVKKRIGAAQLFYGVREGAFALQYATWLAKVLPDSFPLQSGGLVTNGAQLRAAYLADVQAAATGYYGKLQQPDGSWRWDDPDFKADDGGLLVGVMQPFMIGLLLHALSDVYEVATDSTVKANIGNQIVKACRHLYADGPYRKDDPVPYDPSKRWRSLWYFYHGGTTVNPTRFAKGGYSLPGNNAGEVGDQRQGIGLIVAAYGRARQISGDPAFKTMGDELWDAAYGGSDGIRNLFDSDGKGYNQNARWAGSYPAWLIQAGAQPAPQPVPTPAFTPSPDGTEGPVITDSIGALWTLRDTRTLRNGVDVGGAGLKYLYWQTVVYVQGMSSAWFRWTGTAWKFESTTRPPAPVLVTQQPPTPTPTPVPVDPAPTPTPTEPQYEFKKFRWPTDDTGQDAVEKQAAVEGWTDCYVAGNWLRCKRLRQ